jgi:hypothetical protein
VILPVDIPAGGQELETARRDVLEGPGERVVRAWRNSEAAVDLFAEDLAKVVGEHAIRHR